MKETDRVEIAGLLPSGKVYRGWVSRTRISLVVDGIMYYVHSRGAGWVRL